MLMSNPATIYSMKRQLAVLVFCAGISAPAVAAVDGARVYWPLPKNTNIVSVHSISGTANASWSNFTRVQPSIDVESDTFMLTMTRVQPVMGRTVYWQVMLPAATVSTSSPLPVATNDTFVNGLGDFSLGATVNVFGTPALKAKEFLRHDVDLSVNVGLNVTAPTGQYNSGESLNVGSNQWKTRLSVPVVKALGPWVPGRRTTLEVMPAVVLFGDNDNAQGSEIDQDPLYSVEVHLTRDMTRQAFISLDYTWLDGGDETATDIATGMVSGQTSGIDASLVGATVGFEINDNLRLFVTHMQTASEDSQGLSLEGSLTKITLSWSWHDVLERVRQFRKE